ncbi:MAG TPA: hypothetical protein VET27_18460 [Mycobacterium sp.]|nr:hypothetical protein [Mycobacterium sp.]
MAIPSERNAATPTLGPARYAPISEHDVDDAPQRIWQKYPGF